MEIIQWTLPECEQESGAGYAFNANVRETSPLHTHDFYEIFYVNKGKAIHCVNGERIVVSSGAFVFIRPWDVHSYDSLNYSEFQMTSIGFTCDEAAEGFRWSQFPLSMVNVPKLPPHVMLNGAEKTEFENKLKGIESHPRGMERKRYFHSVFPFFIYILCNKIRQTETKQLQVMPPWLSELIEQMSQTENFVQGLPRLLECSSYSHEYIIRILRKYLHMTPTEFIDLRRINYAMGLVVQKKYHITDICYMSGFNNLSHFYAIFKKQTGYTPNEYLKVYGDNLEEER